MRLILACAATFALLLLSVAADPAVRARVRGQTNGSAPFVFSETEPRRSGEAGAAESAMQTVPRIDLRAAGVLRLDGRPVRLSDLDRACTGKGVVALHVEEGPWSHVEWVLVALEAAGVRRVRFDMPDGSVEICFDSDHWKRNARHLVGGHTAAVVTVAAFDIGDPDLPRRVADDAARIEAECGMRPLGELYADPRIDFADVEPALRALRDAGAEIEFRFPPPEGELPESIPPPPPEPWPGNALTGFRCACRPDVIALDLPIADMGEQEQGQEEDDRIVVQLQRGGVFFKRSLHLDEFAEALRAVKERYDLKMRQQGKAGFEKLPDGTLLSKVYVLIRADRAASAQHVGFLLHVLAEEGFYKVQFAVAGEPLEDPGPCVGVPRSKIQVFLPTDGVKGIGGADEPSVHVYVDQGSFSVGSVAGLCEGLCRAVGEARAEPGRKLVVGVHVAAGVTWGQVIEAVNEIARAGAQKIVFVDLPPPDEMTRRMNPLPR